MVDYIKLKYQNNAKICNMDTDSFIINIKAVFYYFMKMLQMMLKNISNYEINRPLPIGTNKKVIGLMKDDLDQRLIPI